MVNIEMLMIDRSLNNRSITDAASIDLTRTFKIEDLQPELDQPRGLEASWSRNVPGTKEKKRKASYRACNDHMNAYHPRLGITQRVSPIQLAYRYPWQARSSDSLEFMVKSPVLVLKMPGKNCQRLSIYFRQSGADDLQKTSDSAKLVVTSPQR